MKKIYHFLQRLFRLLTQTNMFISKPIITLTVLIAITAISRQQAILPTITIINNDILDNPEDNIVYLNGQLKDSYDDATFNQIMNCKNGNLNIINRNSSKLDGQNLLVLLGGLPSAYQLNLTAHVSPNVDPQPFITVLNDNLISIDFNCQQDTANINNSNYFNKVDIKFTQQYQFSFLLNCDPQNRHKSFQLGYLIIAALDSAILIVVAFHSRVWSLKWNKRILRFDLRWFHALIACIIGVILIAALYVFAFKDFNSAFITVRYVGIVISAPFLFICFNEMLFLIRNLRANLWKSVRYCDLLSSCGAIIVVILSVFIQNWILYNFVAICICVACIKLFHFRSLKEAYLFMFITELTITIIAIISHQVLSRSYNDYATQLSSPLFLTVPDLVNNLYKKCSWLPVIDVILPGSVLSYLRQFDLNRSSRFGGVYTIWGNVTFIISTILWIAIEYVYLFSVPFCLVTYNCFMLVVFLFAWRRNEWKKFLWGGSFQPQTSIVDQSKLYENSQRFSVLVNEDILNPLKKSKLSSASDLSLQEDK